MTAENIPPNTDDMDSKVVRQLEYYFGNINLPRDKFLQDQLKSDDGWVPITTLLTFKRLAAITSDIDLIAKAVKGADSEIVSVSDDGQKIRRNAGNPLPENSLEYWQKIKHNTVYMKGFPQDTNLDQLLEFAKQFGNVDNVLMRRTKPDRHFKGSCFITYKTREEAEAAQKNDAKFGETELTKMMQDDYWTLKNKETKEKRNAEKMAKQSKKNADDNERQNAQSAPHFTKGLILAIDGLVEDVKFADLKDFFSKFGEVGYVALNKGPGKAEIRFSGDENGATAAWEKAVAAGEGKVLFHEKELTGKVVEGEEEEKYWSDFHASKQNKFERNSRGGRRGGRGGRGRRGDRHDRNDRKRGNDGADGAAKSKRTVFEDVDGAPAAE